jgi:CheY-like chemotaxis protein/HPt (histidine-containing phosphotransfer) domain-containing protein
MTVRAREKGLQLECHIDPDVPDRLIGDVRRLQQVILNLAGNAIKFTEQGAVIVTVTVGDPASRDELLVPIESGRSLPGDSAASPSDQLRQGIVWREPTDPALKSKLPIPAEVLQPDAIQPAKEGEAPNPNPEVVLHLTVADTGIGISSEDQARIFEPFTQVDSTSTRRHAGTGLGLTICGELIRRMGGVMWVESQLGCGSRFHCTARFGLPGTRTSTICIADTWGPDTLPTDAARPLRILLAEDTPANQKVVSTILSKRGHQVEIARDGCETVERVEREPFDVILMDVQMPNIDGYQATEAIRRLATPQRSRIPIIAITAHAMSGDRDRCLAAGMDEYISKPIDAVELVETVERVASNREPQPRASEGEMNLDMESTHNGSNAVIDRDAAIRRLGGNEQLFNELVRFFDEDTPGLLEEIRSGIEIGDFERVTRSAHSLKGLAANFDATDATNAATRLLEIGRSRLDEEAAVALTELEREISRLHAALSPYRATT